MHTRGFTRKSAMNCHLIDGCLTSEMEIVDRM